MKYQPVISLIVTRNDLNEKARIVNFYVPYICDSIGFEYIRLQNIRPNVHLNTSKLHMNKALYISDECCTEFDIYYCI